jgi:tricarballylate dehydrogenase
MEQNEPMYDVVVVGAGNAALCAALSARDQGATVVVLEKAPPSEQGGNCSYTGAGFRFVHEGIEDLRSLLPDLTDEETARISMAPYKADDFRNHLQAVTHGDSDSELAEVLIAESRPTVEWMHAKGVTWELPTRGSSIASAPSVIPNTVGLSAWQAGPGLVQMLTTAARRNGITILYETKMMKLLQDSRAHVCGVLAQDADGLHEIRSRGVVLACGGFEANPEMRVKYLGRGWEKAKVRGAKYNTGDGHRVALEVGAKPFGQWTGCHATPIDVNAPTTGNLEVTDRMPRRSYTLGIMVNVGGHRFVDEGESFAEQTFVKVGTRILEQERSIAIQIFDSRATPLLEDRYGVAEPVTADTVAGLAEKLGLNPVILTSTIEAFNTEAHDGGYTPRELDGRSTKTIHPPKSNWAIKIDKPPFSAYKVTGGITYTYGGLRINKDAQVLNMEDKPILGLFAAGEIVGGIFYHNSLRAAGLMHGSVFGKLAGSSAANSD